MTGMYGPAAGRARGRSRFLVRGRDECIRRSCPAWHRWQAPAARDVISPGGALATTTMAGRSSRPFRVQTGVQACMTLPGGWAALSCSAIAWCRLGSNWAPVGSSRLMPLRSRTLTKLRSMPSRPSRRRATISGSPSPAAAGCRGRGAGSRLPRPRPGRISARRTAASRSPRDGRGRARWRSRPRTASSGPSSPPVRLQFGDARGGGLHHLLRRLRLVRQGRRLVVVVGRWVGFHGSVSLLMARSVRCHRVISKRSGAGEGARGQYSGKWFVAALVFSIAQPVCGRTMLRCGRIPDNATVTPRRPAARRNAVSLLAEGVPGGSPVPAGSPVPGSPVQGRSRRRGPPMSRHHPSSRPITRAV